MDILRTMSVYYESLCENTSLYLTEQFKGKVPRSLIDAMVSESTACKVDLDWLDMRTHVMRKCLPQLLSTIRPHLTQALFALDHAGECKPGAAQADLYAAIQRVEAVYSIAAHSEHKTSRIERSCAAMVAVQIAANDLAYALTCGDARMLKNAQGQLREMLKLQHESREDWK